MKLYAIACKKLSKRQQFVQATHAVTQYLIDNPNTEWKNGTLVMLKSDDIESTLDWLKTWEQDHSCFHEPYYQDRLTAVCAFDVGWIEHIKELDLI